MYAFAKRESTLTSCEGSIPSPSAKIMTITPRPFRILVTGSRSWKSTLLIEKVLSELISSVEKSGLNTPIHLLHGACPKGADKLASDWAVQKGIREEKYPADWDKHGKMAGFIRNTTLVSLKPDCCIAFWDGRSNGTRDTIKKALKENIPTRVYFPDGTMITDLPTEQRFSSIA